jgi:hypothetical protein
MDPHLEVLLDNHVYSGALHPLHRADLHKSKLSDETIAAQRIRSVPPNMIGQLLRFNMPGVVSAMLIPFADPAGGFMDFPRMKIFPTLTKESGRGNQKKTTHIKYLQPKASGVRLFFPIATMHAACESMETLYVVEGEKKSLALAQHFGVPVVGPDQTLRCRSIRAHAASSKSAGRCTSSGLAPRRSSAAPKRPDRALHVGVGLHISIGDHLHDAPLEPHLVEVRHERVLAARVPAVHTAAPARSTVLDPAPAAQGDARGQRRLRPLRQATARGVGARARRTS